MTREKGHNARQARPGNKNSAKGPRIGRHEPIEPVVAPAASPPVIKRRKRRKTGGRDFPKAHNSLTSVVFRRGPDRIPRQDAALMGRVVMNDFRKAIYDNLAKFVNTPRGAFAFYQDYRDRTEGRPTKKVAVANVGPGPKFFLMTNDGQVTPALPERVDNGATAESAKAQADEALIVYGQHVAPNGRR